MAKGVSEPRARRGRFQLLTRRPRWPPRLELCTLVAGPRFSNSATLTEPADYTDYQCVLTMPQLKSDERTVRRIRGEMQDSMPPSMTIAWRRNSIPVGRPASMTSAINMTEVEIYEWIVSVPINGNPERM